MTGEGGDVVDDVLQLAAVVEASAAQTGAWVVIKDGSGERRVRKPPWCAISLGERQRQMIALAMIKACMEECLLWGCKAWQG
jgi:hypothetical protein